MPDLTGLDHENQRVMAAFLDAQRVQQEQQRRPRRPIPPPLTPEQPMVFGDEAQFLIASSEEGAIVQRVQQRERERIQHEIEASASLMPVPSFDPTLSEADLRADLQAAIDAHDAALVNVAQAEASHARAQQRVAEADAELRNYADLDQRVVAWHTRQIRENATGEPPASLAEEVRQRGIVIDKIDATRKAATQLQHELDDAKRELDFQRTHRTHAAAHIVSKYADHIAASLDTAMNRAEELRRQLLSISAVWLVSASGATSLPLSQAARSAVHRVMQDVAPINAYSEAFRDWQRRLENDAEAILAE